MCWIHSKSHTSYTVLPCSGGIGSCAAPNGGGVHQNFHFIRQGYQQAALGFHINVLHAKSREDFEVTKSGDVKLSLAFPISLESDVYALQCIRSYCQGKLTLWAWASSGYCNCSDVARWYFEGDEAKAKELLSPTEREVFTEYVRLKTLPHCTFLGKKTVNL